MSGVSDEQPETKRKAEYQLTDSVSDLADETPLSDQNSIADEINLEYESTGMNEEPLISPVADTVYVDHYYVPSGVASFGFLMGAVAATFAGVVFYFEFLFIAMAALFLISFVLGIVSVVQFRNGRDLYASNTFGIIALLIDSMLLLLFLFLLTLLFIYFN